MPRLFRFPARAGLLVAAAWVFSSCAPTGFQPESQLQGGVRIIASRASAPYAQPGDVVQLDVLAYDGRSARDRTANPMRFQWVPPASATDFSQVRVCENPVQDAYFGCFSQFAAPAGIVGQVVQNGGGGSDAGASPGDADSDAAADAASDSDSDAAADAASDSDSAAASDADAASDANAAPPPAVPIVSSFRFTVPGDAVSSHPPAPGTAPYGLLIAFNSACAGELRFLPPGSGNPQASPVGCFAAGGNTQLGPENYVLGYTRVYAHEADSGIRNANPAIDCVDIRNLATSDTAAAPDEAAVPDAVAASEAGAESGAGEASEAGAPPDAEGAGVDAAALCSGTHPLLGTPPNLTVSPLHVRACSPNKPCPSFKIGPYVAPTSLNWEAVGGGLHEEIWVDYYATFGGFSHQARVLYDPTVGLIGPPASTDTEFQPPASSAETDGYIWMVVHDNRGGANWVTVPVHLDP